jgi:hypothetical protein
MTCYVKARPQRSIYRGGYRPWLEGLEDRLTPSSLTELQTTPAPIAVGVQPLAQPNLISYAVTDATQVGGGYVTGVTGNATGEAVAVGSDGSVFVAGQLTDPTSSDTDPQGYVKKVDSSGNVVYFVSIAAFPDPGSSTEITGIAVDANGNAYLSGKAHNVDDGSDIGLALVLNPDASGFVYSLSISAGTFPLGTTAVAIDAAGDAVYAGFVNASPTVSDMVAARLAPDGSVVFSNAYTFPGGGSNVGNAVAMPASGASSTIVGWANATGVTSNQNGDLIKLSATGSVLRSVAFGSPTTDSANGVALDAAGNTYVAGTVRIGNPTQAGFAFKLNAAITGFLWGGNPQVEFGSTANAITVAAGSVYVTGADSSGQAYISKLSGTNGTIQDYTVFGGTGGADVGNAIAVRASDGHIFDVGTTNSPDFPVTDGSTLNGSTDGFLTEWTIP